MTESLGQRMKPITDKDAEVDTVFWGSDKHRTWEESESDSDVSYDLDEDDEDSDEEDSMDDDAVSADAESDTSVDEDERLKKRKNSGGYKDPRTAAPKRVIRRSIVKTPKPAPLETPISERRQTRDTTRAITLQVTQRSETKRESPKETKISPKRAHVWTQEDLLEEARQTEEWNIADYEAYIRYTELSEKERMQFLQKRKPKEQVGSYKIISRSVCRDGKADSEVLIFPPAESSTRNFDISAVLFPYLDGPPKEPPKFRYRHPVSMEGYNTISEYREIEVRLDQEDRMRIQRVISQLESRLEIKK
jgi:hypothetical protein